MPRLVAIVAVDNGEFGFLKLDSFLIASNPADFNGDGRVDAADLGFLISAWGTPVGDLDGDGTTSSSDIGLLIAAWTA